MLPSHSNRTIKDTQHSSVHQCPSLKCLLEVKSMNGRIIRVNMKTLNKCTSYITWPQAYSDQMNRAVGLDMLHLHVNLMYCSVSPVGSQRFTNWEYIAISCKFNYIWLQTTKNAELLGMWILQEYSNCSSRKNQSSFLDLMYARREWAILFDKSLSKGLSLVHYQKLYFPWYETF